ncbi:major capsid protein [Clostridium lacusfryxellense]|uniref:major capsid protein n=1 Tax=Clostridium lacusfryxellense TaxID=205328 RepID=UPI001C0CE368|nr:major capsid protein [Clostridium lacusfryxellense]MBU3111998.1 major capsid protein [Clostridium lacusfryxellense]
MPKLVEVFNTNEIINYFKERAIVPMLGEALFPEKKIQDIEFDMILGSGGLPVSASVHAFDTKTQLASREAIEKGIASLSLIKRQIKITEKELIKIQNPRSDAELSFVLAQLYNDAEKMEEGIRVRVEAMRMEVLSSGKIAINENGVAVTIDYLVPAGNKLPFNWSAPTTATPLIDLETIATAVEAECGNRPARAMTSRKIVKAICACTSIKKAIFGTNSDKLVTLALLNDLLSQSDLPILLVNEGKYKVENATGYTTVRYFPENIISMFGSSTLGETIYGLTAEEVKLIGDGNMETASMVGNVFVGTYTSVDPVAEFTKSAATVIPSFPYANELGIATITL